MTKRSFLLFVLLAILARRTSGHAERARQKRMVNVMDAFSQDINKCLFQYWTPYVGKKNPHPGLSTSVKCKGRGLCYGLDNNDQNEIAQYAACYDQVTLIPVFTGHIVHPNIGEGGGGREDTFRADTTIDPVATDDDYKASQMNLYANYDMAKQQFYARGHLTPNADFITEQGRAFTMITTNIAPQWQLFNAGNWNNLEKAIRRYATNTDHALYVFTGTGGAAKPFDGDIKLNERVLVPKWYWKAVCDPVEKQSVFFLGENTNVDAGKKTSSRVLWYKTTKEIWSNKML